MFNLFAQGVLGSTIVLKAADFVTSEPDAFIKQLGGAVPSSAKFFMSYMIMRTLMAVPLRFLITQPGAWQAWLRCGCFFLFFFVLCCRVVVECLVCAQPILALTPYLSQHQHKTPPKQPVRRL